MSILPTDADEDNMKSVRYIRANVVWRRVDHGYCFDLFFLVSHSQVHPWWGYWCCWKVDGYDTQPVGHTIKNTDHI